jgi:hypothetical protein
MNLVATSLSSPNEFLPVDVVGIKLGMFPDEVRTVLA